MTRRPAWFPGHGRCPASGGPAHAGLRARARAVSACVLLAAAAACGFTDLPGPQSVRGKRIQVEIGAFFDKAPPGGFDPILVSIRNGSDRTRAWRITTRFSAWGMGRASERTIESSAEVTVEKGGQRSFEIAAPVTHGAFWSAPSVGIVVLGYGVDPDPVRHSAANPVSPGGGASYGQDTFGVAMSRELAVRSWGPIEKKIRDSADAPQVALSRFDSARLPRDWRAWSGFSVVWMTDVEWSAVAAEARRALLDWVALGGELRIASPEGDTAPLPFLDAGAPVFENGGRAYGFGRIFRVPRNGMELDADRAFARLKEPLVDVFLTAENLYNRNWPLIGDFSSTRLRVGLFLLFLFGFAVLVGPVNLFVFCGKNRRYRLFWTTPLISIAASLLLAALVLFQEGTGGRGRRVLTVALLPEENRMFVVQEQISRTGALLSKNFDTGEPVLMAPIDLTDSIPAASEGSRYWIRGNRYGGDWFSSRTVQGKIIEAVRPTRARVEIIPPEAEGEPPRIVSSIGVVLDDLYALDLDGRWWHAANLRPGEIATAEASSEAAFRRWSQAWSDLRIDASAKLADADRDFHVAPLPGHFYATAGEQSADAVATLPGIRWTTDSVVYLGPCVEVRP